VLQHGVLAFTRDIALGGQSHTDALVRDLGVDGPTAERLKFPTRPLLPGVTAEQVRAILRDVTAQLVAEIGKSIDFFRTTASADRVSRVVVSGGACGAEGLSELLAAEFDASVETFDPFLGIERRRRGHPVAAGLGPAFAIAVGLALREDAAA
jgi:type IV pilus assembly protein PilM